MYTEKDLQVGIIVDASKKIDFRILWPDQTLSWEDEGNLERVNGN